MVSTEKITIIMGECQAHIELNDSIVDVTIPFTNELSDSIIFVLKLNANFRYNSLKDEMFKFTNISEALLYLGKFSNLLRPLLHSTI